MPAMVSPRKTSRDSRRWRVAESITPIGVDCGAVWVKVAMRCDDCRTVRIGRSGYDGPRRIGRNQEKPNLEPQRTRRNTEREIKNQVGSGAQNS
jgi:hypothetical protein